MLSSVSAMTVGSCSQFLDVQYYTVPDEVTHYICLENDNPYQATITMTPSENIAGMIEFSENPVVLAPGEKRFIPFNVSVYQQSTWEGSIDLEFYVPEDNMRYGYWSVDIRIRQGSCDDGDTKSCLIDGCTGTQYCSNNDFGDCIKNDPECGLSGECTEAWTCTPWSECQPNNYQVRTCTDMNSCNTENNKPTELQSCIYNDGMSCNCTDIIARLEELESKTQVLESDVSALQTLVNSIQTIIADIQSSISSILSRLTALENGQPTPEGCAYANPACEEGYQCVNNECVIEECAESWSCTSWSTCVNDEQTRTCTDMNECGTEVNKPVETQSCSSNDEDLLVIFRTNVPNGDYRYSASGSWIAVDCNQDGILESYGGLGVSRTGKVNNPIGVTPEGYPYDCFSGNTEVRIKLGSREIVYLASIEPDSEPELSIEPTEPYTGNGQECYNDEEFVYDAPSGCRI